MFPCRRFALAALIVVGLPCAARQQACRGGELASDAPASFESPAADPGASARSASEPQWPPTWELKPGVTFRLRGRIDTDAIWSSQSAANRATFGDLGDVVGLRRARIGAEGELGTDRRYIAEIDLAPGIVVPRDVYLGFGNRQQTGESQIGH